MANSAMLAPISSRGLKRISQGFLREREMLARPKRGLLLKSFGGVWIYPIA